MPRTLLLFFTLITSTLVAQPNTDVFLFDLNMKAQFELSNLKNISNNEGYDNQPSFIDTNTLLYAGSRNGQTDIVKYNIPYDSKIFINHTDGSEYSPLKIPLKKEVSAIRLEKNGDQKLYKYYLRNGESEVLIEDIVIGYHVWFSPNLLISSVLENDQLALYSSKVSTLLHQKLHDNVGRSLHKIPNSHHISFIDKTNSEKWVIKSINPITGEKATIVATLPQSEDMCWLPNGSILMGHGHKLFTYTPGKDNDWKEVASLESHKIKNITRLAVSPDGKKLAVVAESIAQSSNTTTESTTNDNQTLEPKLENISWIAGNWKGEALGGVVEENWSTPSGGSMMATFKLIKDDKIVFYEIEIIREMENTLILQLKHFNNELKGWETKDETVDFPLKSITATKVVFEGMTFEKVNANAMNVYVDMKQKDGSIEVLTFHYRKD